MSELAGWVAPIATMIAAMMTAANLGARVTGWGFVIFTAGSLCWSWVGMSAGQTNLLVTNLLLTFVNLIGVWRWLGRQRAYEDGGQSAEAASRRAAVPTLFTATGISGIPVFGKDGSAIGHGVEALIECVSGEISYVVVATRGLAGVEEELRAVPRDRLSFGSQRLILDMSLDMFEAMAPLDGGDWPASPKR